MHQSVISVDLVAAARRSEDLHHESDQSLQRAVEDYGRFLRLAQKHSGPLAPTRAVDQMWHLHMLHPVAYHRDCIRLFGHILDHDGGFGSVPEERPALGAAFERTARLWREAYGTSYADGAGASMESCWHDCQSRCWHACSSKDDVSVTLAAVSARE